MNKRCVFARRSDLEGRVLEDPKECRRLMRRSIPEEEGDAGGRNAAFRGASAAESPRIFADRPIKSVIDRVDVRKRGMSREGMRGGTPCESCGDSHTSRRSSTSLRPLIDIPPTAHRIDAKKIRKTNKKFFSVLFIKKFNRNSE